MPACLGQLLHHKMLLGPFRPSRFNAKVEWRAGCAPAVGMCSRLRWHCIQSQPAANALWWHVSRQQPPFPIDCFLTAAQGRALSGQGARYLCQRLQHGAQRVRTLQLSPFNGKQCSSGQKQQQPAANSAFKLVCMMTLHSRYFIAVSVRILILILPTQPQGIQPHQLAHWP